MRIPSTRTQSPTRLAQTACSMDAKSEICVIDTPRKLALKTFAVT
jgi:hypothetical protein